MSDRIRFHCDEYISAVIVSGLRRRGVEVTTSAEAGLLGQADEAQLAFAGSQGRVRVTKDADFLRLHARGAVHAGIAYCKQGTRTNTQILSALMRIHDERSPDEVSGKVIFL